MDDMILYSGTRNASSWAMRAWLALREAGLAFDEVIVDIRRPQRFGNLAAVARRSPSATVPLLQLGDTVIFDSLAIMEFANDGCDGRLLPADPLQRARARSLVAWQHAGLSGVCARLSFESAFYPCRRVPTSGEQVEADRLFACLDRILAQSSGPYLFGSACLADFALAPTAIRLGRHSFDMSAWLRSARWIEAMFQHPAVAEWLAEADRLPPIWYDSYLVPGEPISLYPATTPNQSADSTAAPPILRWGNDG